MHRPAGGVIASDRTVTADELFRMPDDGYRYALVRGELQRMSPAGFDHGAVIMNLPRRKPRHLAADDTLDGAPLPPGFRMPVAEIFAL